MRKHYKACDSQDHLHWGNYHWKKFDERLREFDGALRNEVVDSHALLRAYRHAYGAEINYICAKDAKGEPLDVDSPYEAYEQAKSWRQCMTKMIAKMLEETDPNAIVHFYKTCMQEMGADV